MLAKLSFKSRSLALLDDHLGPSPLRIIHAGGFVEHYYMATTASEIMKKHPSTILARPEVFHSPWDSIVQPEEVLALGEKFYILPRHTVQKLQRRIQRPAAYQSGGTVLGNESSSSVESFDVAKGLRKLEICGVESERKITNLAEGNDAKKTVMTHSFEKMKKVRVAAMWQPSLTVINESSPDAAAPPHRLHSTNNSSDKN